MTHITFETSNNTTQNINKQEITFSLKGISGEINIKKPTGNWLVMHFPEGSLQKIDNDHERNQSSRDRFVTDATLAMGRMVMTEGGGRSRDFGQAGIPHRDFRKNTLIERAGLQPLYRSTTNTDDETALQYISKGASYNTVLNEASLSPDYNEEPDIIFAVASAKFGKFKGTIVATPYDALTGQKSDKPVQSPQTLGGKFQEMRQFEWYGKAKTQDSIAVNTLQTFNELSDNFGAFHLSDEVGKDIIIRHEKPLDIIRRNT
jgi:hypothetical protein